MASDTNKGVYVSSEANQRIFGPTAPDFPIAGMVTVTRFLPQPLV